MKTFTVTIKCEHESFGGYTYRDEPRVYTVSARNTASARKKAETEFDKVFKYTRLERLSSEVKESVNDKEGEIK